MDHSSSAHFRQWLHDIFEQENKDAPEEIMEKLREEIKKDSIMKENIDEILIRSYLKKLGLNRFYENIPSILHKILDKEPIPYNISNEVIEIMVDMYKKIITSFYQNNSKRIGFLSHSYVLIKISQILLSQGVMNSDRMAREIKFTRNSVKIRRDEPIFEKICDSLGWIFIPLNL